MYANNRSRKNYLVCLILKKKIIIFIVALFAIKCQAQVADNNVKVSIYDRYIKASDTLNRNRYRAVSAGAITLWGGSLFFLNGIWYNNYPKSSFHTFNDFAEWQQMDKVGHVYSAYLGSKLFTTFFKWTGANKHKAILLGAGGGLAYQSVIEILDGYSAKWGFSWGDMGANTLGCGLYAGQELLWNEQRIHIKYSTHIQDYNTVALLKRANALYGSSDAERVFKDYNAQTYWLSCNIKSFAKKSAWPAWLNIAVGYGAGNMYGGIENIARDDNGNIIYNPNGSLQFDRRDLTRYRQFYISPDIDFSRIKWRSKFMRDFTKMINLKMPFPSFEYNTLGEWKVNAFHF
jgi:hypothetical protein